MLNKIPTHQEKAKLNKLLHTQTVATPIYTTLLSLLMLAIIISPLRDNYQTLSLVLSATIVISLLTITIRQACFNHCPRCSSWIATARGNCTDCGLNLDIKN